MGMQICFLVVRFYKRLRNSNGNIILEQLIFCFRGVFDHEDMMMNNNRHKQYQQQGYHNSTAQWENQH